MDGSKAAPIADTREKGGQDKSTEGKKLLPPALSKKVDIYAAVPTKSTLAGVLEFMVECYTSQWQSIIRGGNNAFASLDMN